VPDAHGTRLLVCAAGFYPLLIHRAGLLRALQQAGFEIVAAAPQGRGAEELRRMGVRTEVLPFDPTGMSPLGDLMLLRRFSALMKRVRPAAFIAFTVKPNIYGSVAARRAGLPSINNISGLGRVFVSQTLLTGLVERLYRWGLKRSCVVFFENRDDEQLFLARKIVRPDQVVPLAGAGLDLEQFSPRPAKRNKGSSFTFLLAARLLWHKGVREFVEAARSVRLEYPNTDFRILGFVEPPGRDSVPEAMLRSWADEGVIDYAGGTTDVRPMIGAADCVVLPTAYREGVPRILMEAAAMAKPVIATDMPGCRDAVDHGLTGLLCAPKSAKALADAMRDMLRLGSDQRDQMGREGRAKMERQFKEEFVHRAYVEALDRCGVGSSDDRS
jgi:glycosyltransferase involved in cell wall biosynthesis